ncbi:hypothetical protein A2U01_0059741, partial [Trifolium medium]|nr:hypothetical protein [Trifolium medium]
MSRNGSSATRYEGGCSVSSSGIRNCNNLFWKKHEQEVASKLWYKAESLGVEGGEDNSTERKKDKTEECIRVIKANEKRDEIERRRREQLKP